MTLTADRHAGLGNRAGPAEGAGRFRYQVTPTCLPRATPPPFRLTQPGKIAPPTAQRNRQGKTLARNVAASLGYGEQKDYRHNDKGLVVDLGPRYAVANPLGVHLSGYPAKLVARAYHLYALPRLVNRWAVALAYLTDVFFPHRVQWIVSVPSTITASEVVQLPKSAAVIPAGDVRAVLHTANQVVARGCGVHRHHQR